MIRTSATRMTSDSQPQRRPGVEFFGACAVVCAAMLVLACVAGMASQARATESPGNDPPPQSDTQSAAVVGGDLYALVVGISTYRNPDIPALNVSHRDAKDFAQFIESQKELFNKTRLKLLVNEEATRAEIVKYLYYEIPKAGKNDTVILFFSGHGTIDPMRPGQFFFLSWDADPGYLEASAINMSGLKFLRELDCPRVVMIADACHAGGFSRWNPKMATVPVKSFMQDFLASSGRVIITSSRPNEFSLETERLRNSVFTHYFIEGLKGAADFDGNGVVSVNEIYTYVYDRTKNETDGAQHPQFEGTVEGVFPLALAANLPARPQTALDLFVSPPGADVVVDGRLVGKTNPDGSMHLKYVPMGRPVPITIRKPGWKKKDLEPLHFSEAKREIRLPAMKLDPALAAVELRTDPDRVSVKIAGRNAGRSGNDGKLMVRDVQVAVPLEVEFQKPGFRSELFTLAIPESFEGKLFRTSPVKLMKETGTPPAPAERARSSTESPTTLSELPSRTPIREITPLEPPAREREPVPADPATRYLRFDH
ncbi:MAG: caspase family protein [Thermodesulfobacteriota bacterium]